MAQIGTFTRDESGTYTGTIKTLTLNEGDHQALQQGQREGA